MLVFIARINPNTFLHAVRRNDGAFCLRDYSGGPHLAPDPVLRQNARYRWNDVLAEARQPGNHFADRPGNRPVGDSQFWHQFIQATNARFGIGTQAEVVVPEGTDGGADDAVTSPENMARQTGSGAVVPKTAIRHLYGFLGDFSSMESHLALAQEVKRVPKRLARRFSNSVKHFSSYDNIEEPFVPANAPRTPLPCCDQLAGIESGNALSSFLVGQHGGKGTVEEHPALNFQFHEREIIPGRNTGNAVYEDGASAQRGTQLDWLLSNEQDHIPIVAEMKVGNDKDLFYALIQALMYASELVTPKQLERISRHYPECNVDAKSVDIYLVVSELNDRSKVRREIFEATQTVCERLIQEAEVAKYVRRIACLDASLNGEKRLTFRSLFRFDRTER